MRTAQAGLSQPGNLEPGGVGLLVPGTPVAQTATRCPSNPVVATGGGWEGTAVQEPVVIYDAGIFKMWYRGGWVPSGGMGYATSPDGVTWTKYAGNPVIATGIQQPTVFKSGSTFHAYYMLSADLKHRTSTDGINWGAESVAVSPQGQITSWANSTVYQATNLNWWMLLEGLNTTGRWETHLFHSQDGGASWSHQNGGYPLRTLQIHPNGMYGGPDIHPPVNGIYQLWYHADNTGNGLPTDIYFATSPDLINWTPAPSPVMVHQGGWEYDQVADPSVVDVGGTRYMFYDGDNNTASTAAIGMATLS